MFTSPMLRFAMLAGKRLNSAVEGVVVMDWVRFFAVFWLEFVDIVVEVVVVEGGCLVVGCVAV